MSFFRTYIEPKIQEELFNREKSINFNYDSPQNTLSPINDSIQHQFVKSCWARASVVLSGGNVVSLNTLLDENNNIINEPLNIKNGNPYRGKPGITNISSNYKEFFLKQSTLSFYVPDPDEFDTFKKQFLKFGRYMLIEFGWSLPYNLSLPSLSGDTVLEISKDLNKRIKKGNGNYNALVGVITNYNYNLTNEGAYEGTIEVSSMGRNVLGSSTKGDSKVDNIVGYVNDKILGAEKGSVDLDNDQVSIYKTLRNTFVTFNASITALRDVVDSYLENVKEKQFITEKRNVYRSARFGEFETTPSNIKTKYRYKNGAMVINDSDVIEAQNKPTYVTWGWFEDHILNSFFSFSSQDENEDEFRTSIRSVRSGVRRLSKKARTQLNVGNEFSPFIEEESDDDLAGDFFVEDADSTPRPLNNYCKTNKYLYSLGFKSIILPGLTKAFENLEKIEGEDKEDTLYRSEKFNSLSAIFNSVFPLFETYDISTGLKRGQIRNMVFEVDYLIESFSNITSLDKALTDFWSEVSNSYGGFWRFGVVEDDNVDGRIMITDLNIGVADDRNALSQLSDEENPNKIYPFKVYSNKSIVSNIELSTENSSEMATLAVYGSNIDLDATSADEGKGYQALSMRALSMMENINATTGSINESKDTQYLDTILNNISSPVFGNFVNSRRSVGTSATIDDDGNPSILSRDGGIQFDSVPEIIENSTKIHDTLIETQKYNTDAASIRQAYFWFDDNDKKVQIYNTRTYELYDEFKRTMLFLINKAPGEVDDDGGSNYSVVLPVVPIQLSITLQGIGGIKIGDLFHIDYLPRKYRKFCHFMVVNVSHEISPTGWATTLESRMIVDIPKLIESKEISQGKRLQPIIVENTLSETVIDIVNKFEDINEQIDRDKAARETRIEVGTTTQTQTITDDGFVTTAVDNTGVALTNTVANLENLEPDGSAPNYDADGDGVVSMDELFGTSTND